MALKLSVQTYGNRDVFGFSPIDLVSHFSSFTGRSERSQEAIDAMAVSLLKFGQEQPFPFRKDFAGNPVPIGGHTRILGALKITNECMTDDAGVQYSPENPFRVYGFYRQMNDMEAVIHTFVENDDPTRTPLNDVDHALLIRVLSENYGLTDADIAVKLGKNASWVAKHKLVLELDHGTQAMVAAGDLSLDAAVMVVAAIEPSQRPAVIERAKASNNGKATSAAIRQASTELGATTHGKLKRTHADLKQWIGDMKMEFVPGPGQDFFHGITNYLAGEITADELTELAKTAIKK